MGKLNKEEKGTSHKYVNNARPNDRSEKIKSIRRLRFLISIVHVEIPCQGFLIYKLIYTPQVVRGSVGVGEKL